jgi:xylonate dehydratase
LKEQAGFKVLAGNLFDNAVMKTSVISDEFKNRYLSNPKDPNAFEGRAVVFDGPEDYHHRIDDPSLRSTRTPCCSSAASDRSAIPARRRW